MISASSSGDHLDCLLANSSSDWAELFVLSAVIVVVSVDSLQVNDKGDERRIDWLRGYVLLSMQNCDFYPQHRVWGGGGCDDLSE